MMESDCRVRVPVPRNPRAIGRCHTGPCSLENESHAFGAGSSCITINVSTISILTDQLGGRPHRPALGGVGKGGMGQVHSSDFRMP